MKTNRKSKKYSLRVTPYTLGKMKAAAEDLGASLPDLLITALFMLRDRVSSPSEYLNAKSILVASEAPVEDASIADEEGGDDAA